MKHVIGVDLGTSAVKLILMNQSGEIVNEISKSYPLLQEKSGYSEQNPDDWVDQTIAGLSDLVAHFKGNVKDIEGVSFSGQMHGLVLVNLSGNVLRNAILWNDTRTSEECKDIYKEVGENLLVEVTKNQALEGFTLPKLLWVKKNEPEVYKNIKKFMLPKDYVRYKLTGEIHTEYSDAAGTLLLDVQNQRWSERICNALGIEFDICPSLVDSNEKVGTISKEVADKTGLSTNTAVFAGGADNACGAIGAGILEEDQTMVSLGTSGVLLTYEDSGSKDFQGKVHYFNHAVPDAYYSMGVTLAAGHSLAWFKETFAEEETFYNLLEDVKDVPIGANGLLFAPYIAGERTPHIDANIRGSFIGIDTSHQRKDFVRAIMEGVTFSLNETLEIFRKNGKNISTIISIGGGAKNDTWLQMQADIFNAKIVKLENEQGPGLGAAILAAYGAGWYSSLKECNRRLNFSQNNRVYYPNEEKVRLYESLFNSYTKIYEATKNINHELMKFK